MRLVRTLPRCMAGGLRVGLDPGTEACKRADWPPCVLKGSSIPTHLRPEELRQRMAGVSRVPGLRAEWTSQHRWYRAADSPNARSLRPGITPPVGYPCLSVS